MDESTRIDAYHFDQEAWDSYEQLYDEFEWEIPDQFNMATYICDRWADEPNRVAVFGEDVSGNERVFTFWRLQDVANQLANYLANQGVERGDRVGVFTPQNPETLIAHLAAWKLGAISVPLTTLLGPDGLKYRLSDSGTVACIADASCLDPLREIRPELDDLDTILSVGDTELRDGERDLWTAIDDCSTTLETASTTPEDSAIIIYTSGTTGEPKGVLHGHRLLLGHLPFFVTCISNLDVRPDSSVIWTPVEWSWIGSLFSNVMPALYYGIPVVAHNRDSFDPEAGFRIIDKYGVTNFGGPPTTLRMMMGVENPDERYDLDSLRVIVGGGESVGQTVVDWANKVFDGVTFHEGYGQTEANVGIGDCTALFGFKEGTMGKAAPGHEVEIVDTETAEPTVDRGETGEIAIRYEGNPVCFKEYWDKPEKTEQKVQNGWLLTEDLGAMDDDGYIAFKSRKDDVIISSGYRIGPEEIEDSVASHESVADAGVIGVPHEERGQVPKAFVVLSDDTEASEELRTELQEHVKERLAKYEYPRELEFIDELPTTSTEKTRRLDLRKKEGLVD